MNVRWRFASVARVAAGILGLSSGCAHTDARSFRVMRTESIYSARHDAAAETLTVVERDGTVLDYTPVDPAIVAGFWAAEDKDAYYREVIKGKIPSAAFVPE